VNPRGLNDENLEKDLENPAVTLRDKFFWLREPPF
jgi:hypothetical protein